MKFPPPSTIGVLGGGQLGRMLALEARRAGHRIAIFTDEPQGCPAGQFADLEINAAYDDAASLNNFLQQVDVVTAEFENIPAACLAAVESVKPLRPGAKAPSPPSTANAKKTSCAIKASPAPPSG